MLCQLERANPWLTLTPVTEQDENPWWHPEDGPGESEAPRDRVIGPIGQAVVDRGPWADHSVQIAGPPSMVRTTMFRLMKSGVPKTNIRHDPIF
jgi:hypothetical protein